MLNLLLCCVIVLLFCGSDTFGKKIEIKPREYTCIRAEGKIIIDGVLTESSWQKSLPTGSFMKMFNNGQPMTYTDVKMLWDDSNLYVL